VFAASGVGLDRALGPRAAGAGAASGAPTGAWFCPHGGSPGWSAWVVMANPGTATVSVRVTELAGGRAPSTSTLTLRPLQQVYREVSASDPADATVVEFFGGWIGASAVIRSDQSPPGVAAERCESSPRPTWYLLDEPTGPGDTSFVIVMNPFAEDAAFDLAARTESRTIAPGSLRPYVLRARSSVAVRLNDIALQAPGERTVNASVVARRGRPPVGRTSRGRGHGHWHSGGRPSVAGPARPHPSRGPIVPGAPESGSLGPAVGRSAPRAERRRPRPAAFSHLPASGSDDPRGGLRVIGPDPPGVSR